MLLYVPRSKLFKFEISVPICVVIKATCYVVKMTRDYCVQLCLLYPKIYFYFLFMATETHAFKYTSVPSSVDVFVTRGLALGIRRKASGNDSIFLLQ